MIETIKNEWFGNMKGDTLSGIVVALALLMIPLVKEHGIEFLFAATILTGLIQVVFGYLKIAKLMKFIPRAVMIGFVNSLAILIFMAQIPHFIGVSTITYIFVAGTLLMLYLLPLVIKSIPAPLISIVFLTGVSLYFGFSLGTVGDLGTITRTLPVFSPLAVPFSFETLKIILPYSLALSIVGLLETLLTATIVDDMTGTDSNKNKESVGTFDWGTFSYMRRAPKSDVAVMLSTVAIVVATHDLSKGVLAGVLMSSVFFVSKISKIQIHKNEEWRNELCIRRFYWRWTVRSIPCVRLWRRSK